MNINRMTKSMFIVYFVFFFLISYISKPENPEWINFTNSDNITCIEIFDGKLYVGSTGGLSIIDLNDNSIEFINHANSGIPDNSITAIAFEKNGAV